MRPLNARHLPDADKERKMDIYMTIIWQNRMLYALTMVIFCGASAVFAAMLIRPAPILLVDEQGRYIARVEYVDAPPLTEAQLEAMAKRFVQHYLSQNSATIYEDAEIALAAMCEPLRRRTHQEWVAGGRLARVVQRLQLARVVFADFKLLKYLSGEDIQLALSGALVISSDSGADISSDFEIEMAAKIVPPRANNYLGIEVCAIKLI